MEACDGICFLPGSTALGPARSLCGLALLLESKIRTGIRAVACSDLQPDTISSVVGTKSCTRTRQRQQLQGSSVIVLVDINRGPASSMLLRRLSLTQHASYRELIFISAHPSSTLSSCNDALVFASTSARCIRLLSSLPLFSAQLSRAD